MKFIKFVALLVLANVCGAIIMVVDSRPNWDDTGITAGAILMASCAFAFFSPGYWWVWALAIGLWIPGLGIIRSQNYGLLIATAVAFFGAFVGMLVRSSFGGHFQRES